MKSKLLASLLIVMAMLCVFAFGASAATEISTADQLLDLMTETADKMKGDYVLTKDIDLTGETGQSPIGTATYKFSGTFDGAGHTIKGINIDMTSDTGSYPFAGLFGLVQGGTVKNLTVNGTVKSAQCSGGVIAWCRGATVTNCHSYVTVECTNNSTYGAGGIIGYGDFNGTNVSVTVTDCTNHGSVTAIQYAGGIFGLTQETAKTVQSLVITGCENRGNVTVTGGNVAGGIVGYYRNSATTGANIFTVSDCSNYGTISATSTASGKGNYTGGIVGAILTANNKYSATVTLSNLYNEGTVNAVNGVYEGGIAAVIRIPLCTTVDSQLVPSLSISNCVQNSNQDTLPVISDFGQPGSAVYLSATNLVNNTGAKIFRNTVDLDAGGTPNPNVNVTVDGYVTSASTAAEKKAFVAANSDTYYVDNGDIKLKSMLKLDTEIGSPEELQLLMQVRGDATTLDKDYKLMCDIDMTGYEQQPIGISGSGNRFTGSFDGQGHTISGLNISYNAQGTGLFGTVDGVTIKNLNVEGTLSGTGTNGSRVGGLIGQAMGNVTVSDCNVDVTLSANSGASAGILGAHTGASAGTVTITGCTVDGSLSGNQYMGGILGYVLGSNAVKVVITDCTNNASVTTTTGNVAAGILGYYINTNTSGDNTIEISSCKNTGAISTKGSFPGGIVGAIGGSADSCHISTITLTNLHNEGEVTGVSGRGDVISAIRPANGTVCTITDIYGGSPSTVPVINTINADVEGNTKSTYTVTRAYGEGNVKVVYNDNAENITLVDCHGLINSQTAITGLYELTANSDAWVMTYDGPRLADFKGDSVEVDYSIDSAEDLVNLMNAPRAWGGGTYTLTKSISLSGKAQSPIGTGANFKFLANFDGNGYTISGVNIDYAEQGAGLFGTVQFGSIKNLTVKGTVHGQDSRAAGLVGVVRAPYTIENVTTEVTVSAVNGAVGGIVGVYACYDRNQALTITGCTSNSTVSGTSYLGGILAYVVVGADVPQSLVITNCTNNGSVTGTDHGCGGIIGTPIPSTGSTVTITGCKNTGAVSSKYANGGILGYTTENSGASDCNNITFTITDCENTGNVTSTEGNAAGGIVGQATVASGTAITVDSCVNRGTVSGPAYNGGIVAYIYNSASGVEVNGASYTLTGCMNYGTVETTTGNAAGGILGYYANSSNGTVNNTLVVEKSANYGKVSVKGGENNFVGGVVGAIGTDDNVVRADVKLSLLYNGTSEVYGEFFRGSIVGVLRTLASGTYTLEDLCGEGVIYGVICTIGNEELAPQEFVITRAHNINGTHIVPDANGNTVTTVSAVTSESPASYGVRLAQHANWVMTLDGPKLKLFTDEADIIDTSKAYTIKTADDLVTVMNHSAIWSLDFVLANDIDLTGKTQSPIGLYGPSNRKFTGTFDGQNHTISGVNISEGIGSGLFGCIQGTEADHVVIKNLTVDGNVTGSSSRVGGIVGAVAGGGAEILNCTSNVTVNATAGAAGGIVGIVSSENVYGSAVGTTTLIKGCTNNGTVTGSEYNGGIVGYFKGFVSGSELTITECTNNGDVEITSGNCAGGILGYYRLDDDNGTTTDTQEKTSTLAITHCGNYGDITGAEGALFVGGIIGAIPSHSAGKYMVDATVTDVYNCGTITGRAGNTGSITGLINPLAGGSYTFGNWGAEGNNAIPMLGDIGTALDNTPAYTITNAYTVNGTVLPSALDGNEFNTTLTLNASSSISDKIALATEDAWVMTNNGPMLEEFTTAADFEVDYSIDSVEDYLIIINAPASWGGDFTLECNLDLAGAATTPIGNSDIAFTGTFDGKSHTISGLNIQGTEAGTGFFGVVSDDGNKTIIKNFTIDGSVTCADHRFVGGFVGIVCGDTELDGLVNKATVTSGYFGVNAGRIGGIVGGFVNNNLVPAINDVDNDGDYGLTIKNCVNYGKVEGKLNTEYKYSDEYNAENVYIRHSQARVGGIIGSITPAYQSASNKGSNTILVENCKNYGEVTGIVAVGGIAGVAESSKATNNIKITKCSNYGAITSVYAGGADIWFGTWTGGIVGYANISGFDAQYVDSFEVSYCYNEGEISAPNAYLIDSRLAQEFVDEDDIVTDGEGVEDGAGDDTTTTSSIEYRAQIGGIVGYAYGGYEGHFINVKSCFNKGFVWANGNDVAGIVGIANAAHVYDCYNTGRVESTFIDTKTETRSYGRYVGGIIGRLANEGNKFERNFNKGETVSTGGRGFFGVGGGYNAYPDFYTNNFYYNSNTTTDKNSVKVTEAQLSDYSVFTGINESAEWLYTLYGPELVYFHECANTEKIVTTEATCAVKEVYNETCRCLETVYNTDVIGEKNPDNHAFEKSVWSETAVAGTYEFKCVDCGKVMATDTTPYVYVDAYSFITEVIGNDENDGVTPDTAVYTIEEAVRRLATTGGKVILCDRYVVDSDITLPEYEKLITITTKLTDADQVNTGFAITTHGVNMVLGGPTKFEKIIFNGSAKTQNGSDNGYYRIPVICANWNDLEFGSGIMAYGAAYVVAGNSYDVNHPLTSATNTASTTVNLTFGKVTAFNIDDGAGNKLQDAVTFFNRVYLGDRVRDVEVNPSYTVANKTVVATFNRTTVTDMYLATTSTEEIDAQMNNCSVTVNFNDDAYIKYLHTGDGNTSRFGNGTAYIDKVCVNVNDNARVFGSWAFENIRDLTLNISAEEDGRLNSYGIAANIKVAKSGVYTVTGTEKATVIYGSHSFKKGILPHSYDAVYALTETVKDDCDWSEAVLDVVGGVYTQTCSYCGATKTTAAPAAKEFEEDTYKYGISATLANELLVEYLVQVSNSVAVDKCYIKVEHYVAGETEPEVEVVNLSKKNVGASATTYRFYAPGVAAKEMNDRVDITFYAVVDGEIYIATTVSKSIVDYYEMAYRAYGEETRGQAPALMNVLYALFNYGAEAQRYFEYNEENPVNAIIPADKQTSTFTATADASTSVADDCANDVYTVSEFAPILEDRVNLAVSFDLVGEAASTLSFKGSYTDINGALKEFEVSGENIIVTETKALVYVDVVAAKDLRQMITGALYSGDTQVSDSISFSFECYAANASASEKNICNAILNYCDAAKALFYREPTVSE